MYGQGFQAPPLTKVNKIIIIVITSIFIIQSFLINVFHYPVIKYLALSLDGFSSGLIYQIFTYPLVSHGIFGVIFNALLIWFIGGNLEVRWGEKRYILFLLTAIVCGGGVFLFFSTIFPSTVLFGLSGFTMALLIAYGLLYPEQYFAFMLIFPVKAKYFVLLLIGIELYMGGFSGSPAQPLAHLSSMLGAWLFMFIVLKERAFPWQVNLPKNPMNREKKKKNHLKIVEDDKPKYWH